MSNRTADRPLTKGGESRRRAPAGQVAAPVGSRRATSLDEPPPYRGASKRSSTLARALATTSVKGMWWSGRSPFQRGKRTR